MHFPTITYTDFVYPKDIVGIWHRAEEVPSRLREIMLVDCTKDDYFTPLRDGKEQLIAGLCSSQPPHW